MLSRVADALYWIGRYVERAEDTARILHANLALHLDLPPGLPPQWLPVLQTSAADAAFHALYDEPTAHNVIEFMSFRAENGSSILSAVTAARDNARAVRDVISSEMWECINATYLEVRRFAADGSWRAEPHAFFSRAKYGGHLFSGVCSATMTHGEGWHFLRLGQLIERADMTSRILDVKYHFLLPRPEDVGTPFDNLQWMSVLKSVSGHEMYRKRFQSGITPWHAAEFLLLDAAFPRAVHYCLIRAEDALRGVSGAARGAYVNEPGRLLGRLRSEFAYGSIDEVFAAGLHEFLDGLQLKLIAVDDSVRNTYFAPAQAAPPGDLAQEA